MRSAAESRHAAAGHNLTVTDVGFLVGCGSGARVDTSSVLLGGAAAAAAGLELRA